MQELESTGKYFSLACSCSLWESELQKFKGLCSFDSVCDVAEGSLVEERTQPGMWLTLLTLGLSLRELSLLVLGF